MIHRIHSSLSSFKTVHFRPGLNVLLVTKEIGATDKQTRNRAGKTSLIEIIHFLLGADCDKTSIFRTEKLLKKSFDIEFDLGEDRIKGIRSGSDCRNVRYSTSKHQYKVTNKDWRLWLGSEMFRLPESAPSALSFRSLFPYFVRRQNEGGFTTPEKFYHKQQEGAAQVALMYLLGLDWNIACEWQNLRDSTSTIKKLKKSSGIGIIGNLIGKQSEIRTKLTIAEDKCSQYKKQLDSFSVLPQYRDLEREANQLTQQLSKISNQITITQASLQDIEQAIRTEEPPSFEALEAIYAETGIALPGIAIKRYDDVKSFHRSVVRNRRSYLEQEQINLQHTLKKHEADRVAIGIRLADIMRTLKSHGALDQFANLQAELGKLNADVEDLRNRYKTAEQLESTKTKLEMEKNHLTLRLRNDINEREGLVKEAILAFERISSRLYESAGSMTLEATSNGPVFRFPIQGSQSKGIKNMQILCFDLMLMTLCIKRGISPGFLVHDSHLFDGVDGRQIVSALKVGAELADELGFQYIVTLNDDDAFKEKVDDFNLDDYILPVTLTDAKEDGGLFGIRF